MNCNEAELLVHLFLDKETDEVGEKELFAHLAVCSKCREELRQMQNTQKVFINSLEEYPERLDNRIIKTLKEKETIRKGSLLTRRLPAYYLYAASVAVIVILALYFFRINDYNYQRNLDMNNLNVLLNREYEQGEYINLLMNQLPAIKVRAEVDNPEIIRKGI
jgi:predicted anti-sigma-YlaC factor YlaD